VGVAEETSEVGAAIELFDFKGIAKSPLQGQEARGPGFDNPWRAANLRMI